MALNLSSHKAKKRINFVYGMGAAVVIIGATFKILHWPGGGLVIAIGMFVEAGLFVLSAFEPVAEEHDHLHWERMFPVLTDSNAPKGELAIGGAAQPTQEGEGLSKKLDKILSDAKLDVQTVSNLTNSMQQLEESAKQLTKVADIAGSSRKYSEEMVKATNHMESLNSLYSVQINEAREQVDKNKVVLDGLTKTIEGSQKLQDEVKDLAGNLESLNKVYGGMLSAMNRG